MDMMWGETSSGKNTNPSKIFLLEGKMMGPSMIIERDI
jgi:hypothetical protein